MVAPPVVLLGVAAGLAAPAGAGAVSSRGCENRVNDTPQKLIPCIRTGDLWAHMQNFQAIADRNPGADGHPSRNSGEPGYKASVDYVARVMRAAGYDVTIQTHQFDYFSFVGTPQFSEVSPSAQNYALVSDWDPGRSNGSANAAVQPAGGIIIPPTATPSSTSGCSSSDFSGFVAGRIALIQRGGCTFGTKVLNAQAAGASGVIIFNEGNPGRTDVANGSLVDANGNPIIPTIPVAFTSFDIGSSLYSQYQSGSATVVNLSIQSIERPNTDDYNVMAESKGGDPNSTLVVDAHLDAIFGAGMLDNASGSATILDIAQMMRKVRPLHKLRFIWYAPSQVSRDQSIEYFNSIGLNHELFSPVGTDAFNFNAAGIPASGLLTGQDCCKTQDEVNMFGGSLGNYDGNIPSFDGGCVDNPLRWCDNLSNNDPKVLTFMSQAFANTVVRMAFDRSVSGASAQSVRRASAVQRPVVSGSRLFPPGSRCWLWRRADRARRH